MQEIIKKMIAEAMAAQFAGKMSPEQKPAWSQAQTYLVLGNAINGAKSRGFDSCPMGESDPEEFPRILKIPPPLVPLMLCPPGYATDKPVPNVRFPKEEVLF
jgi:nitroreductase / dihydropteridine reductase